MGLTENRERPAFFWKLETRNWQPITTVAAKPFFATAPPPPPPLSLYFSGNWKPVTGNREYIC
ncbi:MAG: hypothetical protein K8L97_11235 [Anaerolineae bacterium]|nr:hypothetical protein [Anaerolineae bacterium]